MSVLHVEGTILPTGGISEGQHLKTGLNGWVMETFVVKSSAREKAERKMFERRTKEKGGPRKVYQGKRQ